MRAHSTAEPLASTADAAACRAMLRGGSRTFFAASLVLPARVRRPATSLYAFCRMADDAIDQGTDRPAALDELHARLERIYAGAPADIPADRAFADLVSRFSIPRRFPDALLEGFAWDAAGRRYEDLSQLTAYAVRVAGTVGAMMAMVMGVREPNLLARACDLGVAMQLTNIARDVGEDARSGRLYLPQNWLRAAGIDADAWLASPRWCPSLGAVVRRVLDAAERLYARSDAGLACLPPTCRPGMHAARLLYAEIGHELARRGLDSVAVRTVVPWQRKTRLLADAMFAAARVASPPTEEILPEAVFLFDAWRAGAAPQREAAHPAVRGAARAAPRAPARRPRLEDRVIWLVDLFERLERRERAAAPGLTARET